MAVDTGNELLRDQYLERVERLFGRLRVWLRSIDSSAEIYEEEVTIKEYQVDPYQATVLVIERAGFHTVRVIPCGRWILGSEGRVDFKSRLGTETLVFEPPGQSRTVRIELLTDGGKVLPEAPGGLIGGEVAEGWLYLQNRELGMKPVFDELLFSRILEVLGR